MRLHKFFILIFSHAKPQLIRCAIMERYVGPLDWIDLQPELAPEVIRLRNGKVVKTNEIAFERFLSHYESPRFIAEEERHVESSYRIHRHLFRLFNSLDVNHDGEISKTEFMKGMHALNRRIPENQRLCHDDDDGLGDLFESLDVDFSGGISIHEFSGLIECIIENQEEENGK